MSIENYINLLETVTLSNKYTRWYINICKTAHHRTQLVTGETHHIIPKCLKLGGEKDVNNMVKLSYKEHYMCHHLLTKMFKNKKHVIKMCHAFTFFSFGRTLTCNQHNTAKKCRKIKNTDRNKSISTARLKTQKLHCCFCGFYCDPGNFKQFHGDNCTSNPNISKDILIKRSNRNKNSKPPNNHKILHGVETICPHCFKTGTNVGNMHRHHFNNCKKKHSLIGK